MSNNTLKTRIILNNKTAEEWSFSSLVPLKGEVCIYSDQRKIKIGDGTTEIGSLSFANLTPEEVQHLIDASKHTHSNKSVLDATTASFTTELLNKLNGIATGATRVTVDSSLSSTSTNPVQNRVINSELSGKVPTSRTVNGKALSANITLSASDVGADPVGSALKALSDAKSYTDTMISDLDLIQSYQSIYNFPNIGDENKIYIDTSTNRTYRWDDTSIKYYCIGSDYNNIDIINGGSST